MVRLQPLVHRTAGAHTPGPGDPHRCPPRPPGRRHAGGAGALLGRWAQRQNAQYKILYLAFHGGPGIIHMGGHWKYDSTVTLDEIADMLGSGLEDRLVHFGSCETLAVNRRVLRRFLDRTGLVAASGFRTPVDWLDSAVFEVLLFEMMLRYTLTVYGARAVRANMLKEYGAMCRLHDFRMVVRRPKKK